MRFLLAPTINLSEEVRVNAELYFLDNMVLGSTPDGLTGQGKRFDVPLAAFSGGQQPETALRDSIRVAPSGSGTTTGAVSGSTSEVSQIMDFTPRIPP